jgi:predicted NBD/HSP70 family sugar kinase
MAAANRELIRAINRFNILNVIRTNGCLSRTDIARRSGLSQASVTGITADLIAEGLLKEEAMGASVGGRRPVLLALNPEGAYTLGVYLSIYQISVVIINFEADIVATHIMALEQTYYAPEALAGKTAQAIQACMWEASFSKDRIAGVGIGVPGLVDSQTGLVRFLPNYQWDHVNLQDLVRQRIDHPTYVENSANTLTIAEQWFGEGRGLDNFVLITLEHGVGMGVVINGQLYRGDKGVAGELGHLTIDPHGAICRCGRRGCLEASVGNYAILREARRAAAQGQWSPPDPEHIGIEAVLEAAWGGDPVLRRIYADAGRVLGVAVANLIKLFNPGKVFIAGRGTAAGRMLFDSMHAVIPEVVSTKLDVNPQVIVQSWNLTDYARGAGVLVLQEIYKHPVSRMMPLI